MRTKLLQKLLLVKYLISVPVTLKEMCKHKLSGEEELVFGADVYQKCTCSFGYGQKSWKMKFADRVDQFNS